VEDAKLASPPSGCVVYNRCICDRDYSAFFLYSLLPAVPPPPVDYTTDDYPDRAENANPDECVRQYMTKGDHAIPGPFGNTTGAPARDNSDIVVSDFSCCISSVVGHREGDGVTSINSVCVGWSLIRADISITKVPLIAVGRKTTRNLTDSKPDTLAFLKPPPLISSEFNIKTGLFQTCLDKRGGRGLLPWRVLSG